MKDFGLLFAFCSLFAHPGIGQPAGQPASFRYEASVPVTVAGQPLANPWAGGLNAGQFSTLFLNDDAVADLVVFDRTTHKLTAFLAVAEGGHYAYRHAPAYEFGFPPLSGWALLADYDHDGRKDLFTHTNLGIAVYRNVAENGIRWEKIADPLYTEGFSGQINLQVPVSDIPAVVDLDEDGDLDVLAYDFSGHQVEYHRNQSVEKYGHARALEFKRVYTCWGNFESGETCVDFRFGLPCGSGGRLAPGGRPLHSGSSLLVADLSGDGHKDVLTGKVDCNPLQYLVNEGTNRDADFTRRQPFPADKPVDFAAFPAAFYEDVDFDGKQDLIAAPNVSANESGQVDFGASAWLYLNQGTPARPDFRYRQSDFLQEQMVDVGENAAPALADDDGDGDLDLFVGNTGLRNGDSFSAVISRFENVGSARQPAFARETGNFLAFGHSADPAGNGHGGHGGDQPGLTDVRPLFADFNGDGATDLGFTAHTGGATALWYIPNAAARGQAFQLLLRDTVRLPLPLDFDERPFPWDLDRDGDLDWLVGNPRGNLRHYENTGTASRPVFRLANDQFGGIPEDPERRNVVPLVADVNADGQPDLLTGDRSGRLTLYPSFWADPDGAFGAVTDLVLDTLSRRYTSAILGGPLFPVVADLDGDQLPELLVGTHAGGIAYLKNTSPPGSSTETVAGPEAVVYPNPVKRYAYVRVPYAGEVELFNSLGQSVLTRRSILANREIAVDLGYLTNGLYVLKIGGSGGEVQTRKLLLQKE
ncbi:MAG: T9SS type A sorting domain-containing protein [Ferruginibacter sp.]|nr:T9SS type A sorting domain-containing protein [Cytophagales bacterium]